MNIYYILQYKIDINRLLEVLTITIFLISINQVIVFTNMHVYLSVYYYNTMRVPVSPATPALDFSNKVIMAIRPR